MQRSRIVRTAVSLTALTLAAAGGAYVLEGSGRGTPAGGSASPRIDLAAYRSFAGCDDLLAYLRKQALPMVGPFGLGQSGVAFGAAEAVPGVARAADGAAVAATPAPAPSAPATVNGTNVQVAGVDEADVTKKAGDLVLTVAAGKDAGLTLLRTGDRAVRVVGRLRTDWRPDQLLVQGTTVLLLGRLDDRRGGPVPLPEGSTRRILPVPAVDTPRVRVAEVDVADPAHPRLVRTLDLDGDLVGARLAGGVVRLAVSSTPTHLPFVTPDASASPDSRDQEDAVRKAIEANTRVVRTSPVTDWLPRWTLTPAGGKATGGSLLDCDRVGVPAEFSGLGTLAMLTFDLGSGGVDRWDGAGVVASGATLYSTGDHTYVATHPWASIQPVNPGIRGSAAIPVRPRQERTLVHAFQTSAAGVRYLGSGSVDGTLLGSYAMDEYEGRLRVATTTRPAMGDVPEPMPMPMPAEPPGSGTSGSGTSGSGTSGSGTSGDGAPPVIGRDGDAPTTGLPAAPRPIPTRPRRPAAASTSAVTVFQLRDGHLERVGRVDGLGPGEVIHAVRFAGPQAFVVTFRQTDPLFVVDLADPARPRVAGSLHLLGYSAYLHPLGDGLVLGVGQDATETGQRTGLLVSLFDVSDPAAPRLLDRATLRGAYAQVESDEHAFTYAGGLALLPLESSFSVASDGGPSSGPVDAGVVAVRVEGRRLGTPSVLHLAASGRGQAVDASGLRTFADGGTLLTVAPGAPQAVAAVHDASSLRWLSGTSF
jgi:Beta propeller domain